MSQINRIPFDLTSEHGRAQAYASSAEGAAAVRLLESIEENIADGMVEDAEHETEIAKEAHSNDLTHISDALMLAVDDKTLTPAKLRARIQAIQEAVYDAAEDGVSFFDAERRGRVRFPMHA